LLGRLIRRWVDDRLRSEAVYIVLVTALALAVIMSHYLGWALLRPYLAESVTRQALFWGGQLTAAALWAAVGLVGFRPGVTVTCSSDGLEFEQGDRHLAVSYDAINEIDLISGTCYHRHYRRYAATHVFVSHPSGDILLLRTDHGPVAVGLADGDAHADLKNHVAAARSRARLSSALPSGA